ncbi:MAG: hypothetical protein ACI8QC_002202 [Planctomycetota bacterium]|jgi:hypothetical protein
MLLRLALALCLALAACAAPGPPAQLPGAENRLQADHLPTPFSAAEIRAGIPAGLVLTFSIGAGGRDQLLQSTHFFDPTEEGVSLVTKTRDNVGYDRERPTNSSSTWTDLQAHASFPAANTVLTIERHRIPLGSPECLLYTVTGEERGKPKITRFWFDPQRPGPPVEMTITLGDQLRYRMLLVNESGR